jgi:uncharacterized protein YqgC (DUF456 family)
MIETLSSIVSFALILGGLVSIIFPIAPSIPTIWFGIFIYAVAHHYTDVSQQFMMWLSLIALGTIILDYTLSRSGVQKLKAGPWGILGAVIGGGLGTFFGAIVTYLIGPIIGAVVSELIRGRDRVYSYQTGNYTIIAFMGGTLVKLVAAIAMIGFFILRLQHKL